MMQDNEQQPATEATIAPDTAESTTPSQPETPKEDSSAKSWPAIKSGMIVKVHERVKDLNPKGEERERTQIFEGLVIARRRGNEPGATITVRKNSFGIGVEKIFPLHLPTITNIEIVKEHKTRRAKLYFVRTNPKKMKEVKK